MSLSPQNKALVQLEVGPHFANDPPAWLERLLNAARAEASPLPPVGWVTVPVQATPEMLAAGWAVIHRLWKPEVARGDKPGPAFREAYAAMLAAAPPVSKFCLGGAEQSDCETNPNTTPVLGACHG